MGAIPSNSNTREMELGGLWVLDKPGLDVKVCHLSQTFSAEILL